MKDWNQESAKMGAIYSYAACNISATWASDSTKGCFNTSDPAAKHPTLITLQRPGRDQPTQYQIGQPDKYQDEIEQNPLNKRGWVLQERYLARRQLSFAKRQVFLGGPTVGCWWRISNRQIQYHTWSTRQEETCANSGLMS
ncbi:hypothetical protein F4860DRAFT_465053 [Xylaria cubensis]|nr:hypothetical protein F4860DRAFT_465053 [Xylaria cubensis]